MGTRVRSPSSARIARVASNPSMTGIRQSIRIRSKVCCLASATATWPFSAVVTVRLRRRKVRAMTSRISRWSSTSSTEPPAGNGCATGACGGSDAMPRASSLRGTVNQKLEPLPRSLWKPRRPPILEASWRAIPRPRPRPRGPCETACSAWWKGSKICCAASGGTPTPVSVTLQCSQIDGTGKPRCATLAADGAAASDINTLIDPYSVNLIALSSRYASNWPTRSGSPQRPGGTSSATWQFNTKPLSVARLRLNSTIRWTTRRGSNLISSSGRFPASMRERSNKSLSMPSSPRAEARAVSASSRCSGSGATSCSRSRLTSTPCRGVRISWLTLPRNLDLAWSAASAASRERVRLSSSADNSPRCFSRSSTMLFKLCCNWPISSPRVTLVRTVKSPAATRPVSCASAVSGSTRRRRT